MKRSTISLIVVLLLIVGKTSAQSAVDHSLFDDVLSEYVDDEGWVNYTALAENRDQLDQYLSLLRSNHPKDDWTDNEKIAYWINAYNAFTLELILKHYPLKGIKDIGSWVQIPFVNTPWDIKFITIGEKEYDLNNIEHDILRKEFNEPRIHFAIVCASYSCPRLAREAYKAETLDAQLKSAAIDFLNDPRKNTIDPQKPKISKIFSWFGGDFKKETTLIEFLNRYVHTPINEDADVSFRDYDWGLNDQKTQS